tara:strand:- start:1277 stop:1501 length:225 start_codon:yes stop_codon:yes gene_type:complete
MANKKTTGGMGSKERAAGTTASKASIPDKGIRDRVTAWTNNLPFIGPVKPEMVGKSKYKASANAILSAILDKKN